MARKSKEVTIPPREGNRDSGKTFVITEMPAARAERWARHAMGAMIRNGMEVSEEALQQGAVVLLTESLKSFLGMANGDADALFDEMFECVQFKASGGMTRALVEDDIEEISTRLFLRGEVVELHTGFSVTGALSSLGASATTAGTFGTPTSPSL